MRNLLFQICSIIWQLTPFKLIRELYFKLFLRLVRNKTTIATVEGITFEFDLGEIIDVCLYLNRFEQDVVNAVENFCTPGAVVFDIGANIGAHTLRFARKVGSTGKVYAFEPTDYAYQKLVRNISLNNFNNLDAFQLALSDRNLASQEVHFQSSWRSNGQKINRTTIVDFICLDDWAIQHKITRVDLIKIDVDGNEFPIIYGGRQLLADFTPLIIIEVGAWHFEDPDENPLNVLKCLGYKFWDAGTMCIYDNLDKVRKQLPDQDTNMSYSINVIAAVDNPKVVT